MIKLTVGHGPGPSVGWTGWIRVYWWRLQIVYFIPVY